MGLIVAFSLPKSSYATMALRELLHRNESKLQTDHREQKLTSPVIETINNQEEEEEEIINDIL